MEGDERMASVLLAELYDPGVVVRGETPAELERTEIDRLRLLVSVAAMAAAIPRRVGGDAEDTELSLDKKRCKRIGWTAQQCLKAWGVESKIGAGREVNKEAAQVKWEVWWGTHQVWLTNRIKYIASWGMTQAATPEQVWAKSAITKLQNEQRWLSYAMRG